MRLDVTPLGAGNGGRVVDVAVDLVAIRFVGRLRATTSVITATREFAELYSALGVARQSAVGSKRAMAQAPQLSFFATAA